MNRPKVLIVDDDAALLNALTGALRLRMPDVKVDVCESGLAALNQISAVEYDAIVTDIKMPGMDGLTLLKEIRQASVETPTLLITGHGQHDLAVQALRGGAFDFIQKPIERDYFVASLRRAIRMRQLSRQIQEQNAKLEQHAAELEQAVQERTQQLREANERKDEFLAILSHELRNPLACILHAVELLADNADADPSAAGFYEIIESQSRQMSRLIDDLLDVSRVSRGKIELRKSRFRLTDAIENAIAAAHSLIGNRNHALEIEYAGDAEQIVLFADEARIEQIIVNLLNNAAKYTEPGGRIRLTVRRKDADAIVEVRDNGIGISADMLPRVFEPFVQASQAHEFCDRGLGIGLTLVQQLVSLHSGEISAASDGLGRGSTFTMCIPVAEKLAILPQPPSTTAPATASGRRIVVADDVPSLARLMRILLEQRGHTVVAVAGDGDSAVDAIAAHAPDVALLDIGLPGIDGYDVAREIRRRPELDKTLLVAISGYGTEEDQRRSSDAGFDHHLVKPVDVEVLHAVIAGAADSIGEPETLRLAPLRKQRIAT